MTNGFDITAFIPKFVDENKDRIQKLNQAILALEKNASNHELIKEIMREAHTLKGTARIMGFSDIVTLSHKVEDVFVKINEGNIQPTKELFDIIFHTLDILEKMAETKLKDTHVTINADELCNQLEAISGVAKAQDTTIKPSPPVQSPLVDIPSEILMNHRLTNARENHLPPFSKVEEGFKEDISELNTLQEGIKTIKIGLDKVDALYNNLVELLMAQMVFHQRHEEVTKLNDYVKKLRIIKTEPDVNPGLQKLDNKNHEIEKCLLNDISKFSEAYEADIVKLNTVTENIRQQVMIMRMQPVSMAFDLAARHIRDLSRQVNKEIELMISGSEVQLDNNIIEMLKDPLVHLLRNAVDHGIEDPATRISLGKKKTGAIILSAKQEGGEVFITVEDDGKGLDKELIKETSIRKGLLTAEEAKELSDQDVFKFIIKPGFTTSKIITDTSGRGVGLDVVKTVVDRLNGSLIVESNKGMGSRFILKVPSTIALITVLIVRVENMILALPSNSIEYITHVFWKDIKTLEGKAFIFVEGQTIPLVHISDIFMLGKKEKKNEERIPIIFAQSEGKRIGFVVSEFLYEKEIVFREFKGYLKRPKYFSGVTTLGTGEILLIVNTQELIGAKDLASVLPAGESLKAITRTKKNTILIAEDSMITAELEKNILVNAGYEVDIAIDGIDAMEKLHGKKYNLLVTDIDMPRMNGFELTARVRKDKRLQDLPVVIVTAKEKVEDKRKGIEVGADAYILKKEFDQSNLLNVIKRLIEE